MTDREIVQIWNKFPPEAKDMSFENFKTEIQNLTNPVQMSQDLADIQMQKAIGMNRKIQIDRKLKEK